jgi:hypothetical protein
MMGDGHGGQVAADVRGRGLRTAGTPRRRPLGEGAEDQADHMLGLLVGIKDDLPGGRRTYPMGSGTASSPCSGLAILPDSIAWRIRYSSAAHHSLQPDQQSVVVDPGVVYAVGIGEQHVGQRA